MDNYSRTEFGPSRTERIDFSLDCSFIYQQLAEKGIISHSSIFKNKYFLFLSLFVVTIVEDSLHANEVTSLWFFKTECFNYFSSSFENCLITQICKNTANKRIVSCFGSKAECYKEFKTSLPSSDLTETTSTLFIRTDYAYIRNFRLSTSSNICDYLQFQKYSLLSQYFGQLIGFVLCSVLADRYGRKNTFVFVSVAILLCETVAFIFDSILLVESVSFRITVNLIRGLSIRSAKHLMTVLFLETNPDVNTPYIDYFQIIYFIRLSAIVVYIYLFFSLPFGSIYLFIFGILLCMAIFGQHCLLESPRFYTEKRDYPALIKELKKLCLQKKDSLRISLEYVETKDLQLKSDVEKEELKNKIREIFSVSFILNALVSIEFRKYRIGLKLLVWIAFESIYSFSRIKLMTAYFSDETFRIDLILLEILFSYVFIYFGSFIIQQFGGRKILAACLFLFTVLQLIFEFERLADGDPLYFNFERKAKRTKKVQEWNYLLLLQLYLAVVCKQVFEMETIINVPSLYRCTLIAFYKCVSTVILISHSIFWLVVEGEEDFSSTFALFGIFCICLFTLDSGKEQLFELNLVENKAFIMNYSENNLLSSIKRRYLEAISPKKETKSD